MLIAQILRLIAERAGVRRSMAICTEEMAICTEELTGKMQLVKGK
jgi:hypothetical protein